jgi:hypothetical protein
MKKQGESIQPFSLLGLFHRGESVLMIVLFLE